MSITDYTDFDIVNSMLNFLYAEIKIIEDNKDLDFGRKIELIVEVQRKYADKIIVSLQRKTLATNRTN